MPAHRGRGKHRWAVGSEGPGGASSGCLMPHVSKQSLFSAQIDEVESRLIAVRGFELYPLDMHRA